MEKICPFCNREKMCQFRIIAESIADEVKQFDDHNRQLKLEGQIVQI
ncbi:MAG: hypothetical protein Q8P53_04560 [Candidatus Shapirobacteria bacterium]|nr:hypothetical protein [Candidatus Shapirobacteria bacterium]